MSQGKAKGAPNMVTEIEYKYSVTDDLTFRRLLRLNRIGAYDVLDGATVEVTDTYLDTHDFALLERGYALRLRNVEGRTVAELKSLGVADGGLHTRLEIEGEAGESNSVLTWPDSELKRGLTELVGDQPLRRVARIHQLRHKRRVLLEESEIAEMSLDNIRATVSGVRLEWLEAEVELKSENELELTGELNDALLGIGLRPELTSKYQKALSRAHSIPRNPVNPSGKLIDEANRKFIVGSDFIVDAARLVLSRQAERLDACAVELLKQVNETDVHQMRVATRRLRAALDLFGPHLGGGGTKQTRKSLGEAARALGVVRELDVFLKNSNKYARQLKVHTLKPIRDHAESRRHAASHELRTFLDGSTYQKTRAGLQKIIDYIPSTQPIDKPAKPKRVAHLLPAVVWMQYQRIASFESHLWNPTLSTLHRLRIEGKRLRYTLEFAERAMGARGEPVLQKLIIMQDLLGEIQDVQISVEVLGEYLLQDETADDSRKACLQYVSVCQARLQKLVRRSSKAWKQIMGEEFRADMGLAVAAI